MAFILWNHHVIFLKIRMRQPPAIAFAIQSSSAIFLAEQIVFVLAVINFILQKFLGRQQSRVGHPFVCF
jgi:hypothetical protein